MPKISSLQILILVTVILITILESLNYLNQLNINMEQDINIYIKPKGIVIFTTQYCPYCIRAKKLFDSKEVSYQEVKIDGQNELRNALTVATKGQKTVPQIFINGQHIGGCDYLYELENKGQLDAWLK